MLARNMFAVVRRLSTGEIRELEATAYPEINTETVYYVSIPKANSGFTASAKQQKGYSPRTNRLEYTYYDHNALIPDLTINLLVDGVGWAVLGVKDRATKLYKEDKVTLDYDVVVQLEKLTKEMSNQSSDRFALTSEEKGRMKELNAKLTTGVLNCIADKVGRLAAESVWPGA